jgi:AcrR family transcriptional regulator
VSHNDWQRHADASAAVDGLLDAAGVAFARFGVARATMMDVARLAGCSRATLYRYFPNREALHLGFVHRATLRIAADMTPTAAAGSPQGMVDLVMAGISAVRADPLLAVWFEPENMAVPIAVSQNSELLQAMTAGMAEQFDAALEPAEIQLRGTWLLRCIVSFLAMPAANDAEERSMIEAFVVPLLIPRPDQQRSRP